MSDLKLPALARDFNATEIVVRERTASPSRPFQSCPWNASSAPEVLSHARAPSAWRASSPAPAPLLFNHNWDDPVGMLQAGRLKDGRLVVDAKWFDTARAKEVRAMVEGGLRNVSIGYEIRA